MNDISQKENISTDILQFLKDCYSNYLTDIREKVKGFPQDYIFPDGNPILPVLPTNLIKNSIMLIGAFPSARFERRNGFLIPVGNNLSPFADEIYFDGREIRKQASREALDNCYFPQLGLEPKNLWITDLVKVYLFPQKHIKNCIMINTKINYVDTHKLFQKIAIASFNWIEKEIAISNPRLIITLGEIPARVIRNDFKTENRILLNGKISDVILNITSYKIASLAHPEIRRINKEWNELTFSAINNLRKDIKEKINV